MKFAPEYVEHVLNDVFEDAKVLLLSPLMAINYAHLVMLTEQGIISADDARSLRDALDGIPLDETSIGNTGVANNNPVSARAICWILAGHTKHHLDILAERYGVKY